PLEKVMNQLALQISHEAHLHAEVHDGVRPSAQIDGCHAEPLVPRHYAVPRAGDALAATERARHGFAERDADILDGVVLVDVEISLGADSKVEGAVSRHQLQHVIQKADAGGDVVAGVPFDAKAHANLRLASLPVDYGAAHKPSRASMTTSVWRASPSVTRVRPPHPGAIQR